MNDAVPNFIVPYNRHEIQKMKPPEKYKLFQYKLNNIYIDKEYYYILIKAVANNGKVYASFYTEFILKNMEQEGYIKILNTCSDMNHKYCIIAIREDIYLSLTQNSKTNNTTI